MVHSNGTPPAAASAAAAYCAPATSPPISAGAINVASAGRTHCSGASGSGACGTAARLYLYESAR
eukprot:1759924-Prymnesium_polylepis.2